MRHQQSTALITGAASGLGLASASRLVGLVKRVIMVDLPSSNGKAAATRLGPNATFVAADITDSQQIAHAVQVAGQYAPLRILVHCAGRGGPLRIVDKDGRPGSLRQFTDLINVNLIGTFNVLRLAAAAMASNEASEGERGVCVLTSSIAAWEGQIGQVPYASSKAGIVGMTLSAARDLSARGIRVCTIAPGVMETPLLSTLPEHVREQVASAVPHPRRFGTPEEYASLALHIIENGYLNGETIRLDGALRMAPR